jgi:hypothetical protein
MNKCVVHWMIQAGLKSVGAYKIDVPSVQGHHVLLPAKMPVYLC